jgi:hypothetical protein
MSIHDVIHICQQIAKAGKKPTTALVKVKLGPGVPLAQIIRGIQTFNANPDIKIEKPPAQATAPRNLASGACQCEAQIKPLIERVGLLEAQITSLQAQVLALTTP